MDKNLNDLFSLSFVSEIIEKQNYKNIVLQLGERFLEHGLELTLLLQKRHPETFFSLVYETACSPCCLDILSAEHVAAEAILHYGPRCQSIQQTAIREISFQGCLSINRELFTENLQEAVSLIKDKEECFLCIEPCFLWCRKLLEETIQKWIPKIKYQEEVNEEKELFSKPLLLYVGSDNIHLRYIKTKRIFSSFLVVDPRIKAVHFVSEEKVLKEYGKRLFFYNKVEKATIFGLVLDSNTTNSFSDQVTRIKEFLLLRGRLVQNISIGGVTVEKLLNFTEVDLFVTFSCEWSSNTLTEEIVKYVPVISAQELFETFLAGEEFYSKEAQQKNNLEIAVESFKRKSFKGI